MKKLLITIFTLALLFSLDGCFLFPDHKEVLPPPTQTGANTFGCLVNGQVWIPKGSDSMYPNLIPTYDPNFNSKPEFGISCYRVVSNTETQGLGFYVRGIYNSGYYEIKNDTIASGAFDSNKCNYYYHDTAVYRKGTITITKFALPIISGTFDFVLYKPGCDSIKITQGRFDIKL